MGRSSKNTSDAVQISRWVEGNDLSASHAALGEDLVIDLGVSLARALTLIYRENILHLDVADETSFSSTAGARHCGRS